MIVWIAYDKTRDDGRAWAVRTGRQWLTAASVQAKDLQWQTVYRPNGAQPRAYLRAEAAFCVQHGDTIRLG